MASEKITSLEKAKEIVEARTKELSDYRDKLRESKNELDMLLEGVDEALTEMESATSSIENAIDSLSQYV